jgi:hypothetical protein
MAEHENETFIDADAGFSNEKDNYEGLILKQMARCTEVLSREMTSGAIVHKAGPTGTEKYIEDVNELVINHVDTLKMLMSIYINGGNKDQLLTVLKEIEEYKKEFEERIIIIPGRGKTKLGDAKGIHVNNLHWKEFINLKARRYREIFEILVNCYNQNKAEIRKLEEE